MGTGKKEANRKANLPSGGDGMANVKVKGENFYRSAKKVKTLNIFKDGKPQRNASGKITKAGSYQSRDAPIARVEPNRKWFTNSRVISQDALAAFRGAVAEQSSDPYSYLLKQNKLPMSLIRDSSTKNGLKQHQAKMTVETAPFSDTFGPKAQRKRVKIGVSSLEDLAGETEKMHDTYLDRLEQARLLSGNSGADADRIDDDSQDGTLTTAREAIFSKGQSRRIYNELYKVIDSSDVVLHVLDARDPDGTRCRSVIKYIREEHPHKHLVFVLNKSDLVPTNVAASWVRNLSKEYPTLAFHSSIKNSFGKGSLISLLRQFSSLHSDRKQISVGLVGYPNTGKSSIINTLRAKKVCNVAPIAGETKVWQYITLMKRIYLIDCPGIVPPNQNDTEEDLLLRGVVRVENVQNPEQYVAAALRKCKQHHVERTYDLKGWTSATEFLELLARKGGRLLKGGEPDLDGCAKMVLNDFLRGKIPWFTPPPKVEGDGAVKEVGIAGRIGRLGEMGMKRRREEDQDEKEVTEDTDGVVEDTNVDEDEDFNGFDNETEAPDIDDTSSRSDDIEGDEEASIGNDATDVESAGEGDESVMEDVKAISAVLADARKKRKG
ncbi:putative nucleolar GTPase [Patellaria atrata CBS 101060]|uniref:Nucleolar GTP-binding protein 2 n=1 Tax=Patellaria atrata CBS 101060 TaxID=1346257 RepID=A0A9P4S6F4_9PEZI|nr:putative nucleolar GTPase [Patellaria atrata CBS 101060]